MLGPCLVKGFWIKWLHVHIWQWHSWPWKVSDVSEMLPATSKDGTTSEAKNGGFGSDYVQLCLRASDVSQRAWKTLSCSKLQFSPFLLQQWKRSLKEHDNIHLTLIHLKKIPDAFHKQAAKMNSFISRLDQGSTFHRFTFTCVDTDLSQLWGGNYQPNQPKNWTISAACLQFCNGLLLWCWGL